jgi:hypothetical protein
MTPSPSSAGVLGFSWALYYKARPVHGQSERETREMTALSHPYITMTLHKQRQSELEREARSSRLAASLPKPNVVERYFIKRREGKVTWIETIMVHRSA